MPLISGPHEGTAAFGCLQLRSNTRVGLQLLFTIGTVLFLAVPLSAAPPEKHLSIYSTAANYSLPIVQRQGRDYVGLLELLEPLGTVSAKVDGQRWRLHYNNVLGEFTADKARARVQGRDADLSAKFILENGRGLVPLASLNSLLPRFLGGPATLHEQSNRLFIGSVATHFTASVASDDPSRLVFQFTAPVNPSVASEPAKVRLTFNLEPVTAPASPTLTFSSKLVPSATYSESGGAADITVTTTVPLLATFSNDGRTITLAPPKSQIAGNPAAKPPTPPAQSVPAVQPPTPPSAPRRYFAVVDASHGGADRGEALSASIAEKDVTVAFARLLRQNSKVGASLRSSSATPTPTFHSTIAPFSPTLLTLPSISLCTPLPAAMAFASTPRCFRTPMMRPAAPSAPGLQPSLHPSHLVRPRLQAWPGC